MLEIRPSTNMDSTMILFSAAFYFAIWLCISVLTTNLRARKTRKTPPGPSKLPIIGNLHLIGKNPHQSFAKLSKKHGPIMSVRLGSKEAVIVSNASIAKEILQKNDQACSSRGIPNAAHALDHHKLSMVWLPVAGPWRNIRKLCKERMFAPHRLDASQELRQEKLQELAKYLERCGRSREAVDIGSAAFITSLNLMSRTLFSADFADYDANSSTQELKEVVWGVMTNIGLPNLSDFFPVLRWIDPQGIMRGTKLYFGKLFDIFDDIIKERLLVREASGNSLQQPKKNDLLEAILDENSKNDSEFTIELLKHMLLDLFVAGIDTTSNTIEWAMSELLRNPDKIEKARAELKEIIGEKTQIIQESDISKLPYLQAVVKETFRLHPPGPLLVPHKANQDVEIDGYIVPKDTEILINVWASGRNEATWTQPEVFMPERFLESEIEIKGNHFELIPFGAGRRMCPGLPLAYRMVHLMLAAFIHNLHWKLEGGVKPEDLNMEEKFGLTVQKSFPLKAIPSFQR